MNIKNNTSHNKKNSSEHTFYLNGLTCANCAGVIEEHIKNDDNYENISFSFATKKLKLQSELTSVATQNSLQNLVNNIESGVSVDTQNTKEPSTKKSALFNTISKYIYSIIGTGLLIFLLIFEFSGTFSVLGYILAYILIGYDVIMHALKNIIRGKFFDEYFLMTLATIGAFALGEYTEAVAVMLFYKIGETFQDYAVDQSRKSIQSLLHIKADYANKINGNEIIQVSPESLEVNDIIIIRAGEKIPVDGIVIEGTSSLDTSALTGESLPREIGIDESILSGSINHSGLLKIRVTKTYENSTIAKILDMVENATSKKAKTEQFITKFAKIYTPIVVILATLLAFVPPLLGYGAYGEWISRALIFLVISCPCALVLSVPLAYFAGLGCASRHGILIKGGNYLEALNTIDTYVFDKTGTLTSGKFRVSTYTNEQTLELAAYIEQYSTHPLAVSILEAYHFHIPSNIIDNVEELPGVGIRGNLKEKSLLVGNSRLMTRENIIYNPIDSVGSVIYVAYDSKYIGHIEIRDELKEHVQNLSTELKLVGGKFTYLLSGDQEEIVAHTAQTLKIDSYHSELLPADKLAYIEQYIKEGKKVLFIGDGINDAPVLARAEIGVAMGGMGSDAAVEAADIIFMTDEPSKLLEAKKIAKRTRKIVIENIIFALGIKLFFLTLGALGIANMYEAIFADVGVALIAVLNSMRALKIKL